jgi:ATPase subunit of ABC transporter with duplicated ATPase domains
MQRLLKEKTKKSEDKIRELEEFIRRFSANKSKSRQATSRRKMLEKLTLDEIPASSRRYPWVGFQMDREPGKDRLTVDGVTVTQDGIRILDNVSFIMGRDDKIAFIGGNEIAITAMFKVLAAELEPDKGTVKWGVATTQAYFPKDNSDFFAGSDLNIMDWMRQFSVDKRESYLRTFLGRMLFSGDEVYKDVKVLSGGEKVRCMLSKMMLSGANVLLFDQPTNHLDLESIAALNNGMSDFKSNIIFTTHDHQIIQTVANRIIEFTDAGRSSTAR